MNRDNLVPPLLLGLVGLCCLPLGLVAAVWGTLAFFAARGQNRPPPPLAVVCMVLGGLSLFTNLGLFVYGMKLNAERKAKEEAVTKKLEGHLDGAELEKEIACELAEQHLLKDKLYESVTCAGEWTPGAVARLEVTAKSVGAPEHRVFCFARAHRWYVLMVPGDGKCPETAPPVPSKASASLDQEEDLLRKVAAEARAKRLIASFEQDIAKVRAATEVEHQQKSCKLERDVKAAYVDYDRLPGAKNAQRPWKLLTHSSFAKALDDNAELKDRAAAIDGLYADRYVIVFQSEEVKEQPKGTGNSFIMGEFEGWMSVVELSTGRLACETPFRFVNADTVGGGVKLRGMPDKSTQQLADDDFEDKFEDAARAAAKHIGGDRLTARLGY